MEETRTEQEIISNSPQSPPSAPAVAEAENFAVETANNFSAAAEPMESTEISQPQTEVSESSANETPSLPTVAMTTTTTWESSPAAAQAEATETESNEFDSFVDAPETKDDRKEEENGGELKDEEEEGHEESASEKETGTKIMDEDADVSEEEAAEEKTEDLTLFKDVRYFVINSKNENVRNFFGHFNPS